MTSRTDLGRFEGSAMHRILSQQHRTIEHGTLGLVVLGIFIFAFIFGLGVQVAPLAV
ncbi:hypothetical protein [Pararhizobium sp.]|uniref:hypothetical protein n=1 Tax=Pararhizobium sp. TaxID=1977563 RepID=UPI002728F479|nr:hypothetical protein [Pararhizobium sp.]MDO9416989.1 hypothetical protein [Pararhizobium sp.]